MKRGILFSDILEDDQVIEQLVIHQCYRKEILIGPHNEVGHPGQERTARLMRPEVGSDIVDWVTKCERCYRHNDYGILT